MSQEEKTILEHARELGFTYTPPETPVLFHWNYSPERAAAEFLPDGTDDDDDDPEVA